MRNKRKNSSINIDFVTMININAQSQTKSTREIDLTGTKFVEIKLEGKIILVNTDSSRMKLILHQKKKGI